MLKARSGKRHFALVLETMADERKWEILKKRKRVQVRNWKSLLLIGIKIVV